MCTNDIDCQNYNWEKYEDDVFEECIRIYKDDAVSIERNFHKRGFIQIVLGK